ncbi:MAG TPA: ROK family protein, partial [Polyangiaceae bacterium]|nr:ROK family protein [Polyangiaceae bacterium]
MTRADRHLVFDVGGTQLRAAVYDGATGALVEVARGDAPSFSRHPGASWPELRARLVDEMSALRSRVDPAGGVGSAVVAFAGPVDRGGQVLAAPTLWGASGRYPYALDRELMDAWPGTDVRVLNDVTAAGYRYMRGIDDEFCVVAVSTGIGNKVFVRGQPLLGPSGAGGEIGHLQVDASPAAAACDCGGRGHVGAIASGRGVTARAQRRAGLDPGSFAASTLARGGADASTLTAEAIAAAYRGGDPWAGEVVREGADALALAFAAIHLAVGVERFVLVGGFALGLGAPFCEAVQDALAARCWQGRARAADVVLGEADGSCALLGAG